MFNNSAGRTRDSGEPRTDQEGAEPKTHEEPLSLPLTTGDRSQSSDLTARLTCSSDLRRRRSVPFWVDGSDGDFVAAVGLQGLQNQAVLTAGHRPLQGKHGRHLEIPSSKCLSLTLTFFQQLHKVLSIQGTNHLPLLLFICKLDSLVLQINRTVVVLTWQEKLRSTC